MFAVSVQVDTGYTHQKNGKEEIRNYQFIGMILEINMPYTYRELHSNPALLDDLPQEIELVCKHCGTVFHRTRGFIHTAVKRAGETFCSLRCHGLAQTAQGMCECICAQCGKQFSKRISQTRSRRGNNFCSRSCSGTYNNLHKTTGTRRSKLEVWLEEQLRTLYPDLEILFNMKEAINAELDIHFLDLNLAFELNGIYHYEPIHGQEKLASIQTNDHRKFAACAEKGIELCILDVSAMTYFKPAKGQRFLEIIISIVNAKRAEDNQTNRLFGE